MSFKHGCRFTSVTKTSYCISNKDQCHFSIYQEVTLFFLPRGNTKSQSWFIGKHLSLTLPVTELPALTCSVNLESYIDFYWFLGNDFHPKVLLLNSFQRKRVFLGSTTQMSSARYLSHIFVHLSNWGAKTSRRIHRCLRCAEWIIDDHISAIYLKLHKVIKIFLWLNESRSVFNAICHILI